MSGSPVVFGTIHFEELPLHDEDRPLPFVRPTMIEEDEDDARSLLYLFEDNDFERAATLLALEEARRQAQARADALAEEQRRMIQRQRIQSLAARLEHLLEEDDELIDMLGRRLLATNGYQTTELWGTAQHHRHGPHYFHSDLRYPNASQIASTSRMPDIHAAWDELAERGGPSWYARASPFIHADPVMLHGHAPYVPKALRPSAATTSYARASSASSAKEPAPSRKHATIAFHPLTGVPMLLMEDLSADPNYTAPQDHSDRTEEAQNYADDADEEDDPWSIDDESDLDWLGRELLRRQGGDNVWVLGTDESAATKPSPQPSPTSSSAQQSSLPDTSRGTLSPSASTVAGVTRQGTTDPPTLPDEVEEVDSDHELARFASYLSSGGSDSAPPHRVATALAHAMRPTSGNDRSPAKARRQRAATVMSESEEEELETVGRPVVEDAEEDAGSLNDRPRKSIKVADIR